MLRLLRFARTTWISLFASSAWSEGDIHLTSSPTAHPCNSDILKMRHTSVGISGSELQIQVALGERPTGTDVRVEGSSIRASLKEGISGLPLRCDQVDHYEITVSVEEKLASSPAGSRVCPLVTSTVPIAEIEFGDPLVYGTGLIEAGSTMLRACADPAGETALLPLRVRFLRSVRIPQVVAADEMEAATSGSLLDDARSARSFAHLLARDFAVRVSTGFSNYDGDRYDGGGEIPIDLDRIEAFGSADIGWFDRKLLRDICALSDGCLVKYLTARRNRSFLQWGVLDAIKVTLSGGYGTAISDPQGDDNARLSSEGRFRASITWTIPLEGLVGADPLD